MENFNRYSIRIPLLVLCGLFCFQLFGQSLNYQVNGQVTDGSGQPLIGVTILVGGTTGGTVSDLDGNYQISSAAPAGKYTLRYSYLGFGNAERSFDLTTDGQSFSFVVKMGGDALNLDEVLVTGSSLTSQRKALGNAINSVQGSTLNQAAAQNVTSALQGKIAGAQITQNSGDPAGGFSIRLRGASTLNGSSDPLFVIDGVIVSNTSSNVTNLNVGTATGQNRLVDINPNDIERIETINGAAAAAIYGSRASNGVVLITTKKGSSGAPRFTFSSAFNVNTLRERVPINLFGKQFGSTTQRLYPIAGTNAAGGLTVGANFSSDLFDVTRYDYQDDIFQTGLGTDTYISASGGNEKSNYFASGGYLFNEGIIKNTDARRYNGRIRYNQQTTDWLSFSVGLQYINNFSNQKPNGNVFWSPINAVNITNNIYDINQRDAVGNLQAAEPTRINPLTSIEEIQQTEEINRVISDFQMKVIPFEGFTADLIVGVDNYSQIGNNLIPVYPYAGVNPGFFADGYAATAAVNSFQSNIDLNLKYEFDLSSTIRSTTQAGGSSQFSKFQSTVAEGRGLAPFVRNVSGASNILSATTSEVPSRIWGYYLQQVFSFNDRLFLTAAGRIDAASRFSKDNRNIFYPKVSASYLVSDEPFWKDGGLGNTIETFRLRSSWGQAGNLTGIGEFTRFNNFSPNQFLGLNSVNASSAVANADVTPETQTELEIGFDLGLLNQRVGIGFTYYSQEIEDLLLSRQLAASAGGTSTVTNVGTMENKGIELTLTAQLARTKNFSWNIFGNFSRNRNQITELGQERFAVPNPTGAPIFLDEGEAIGVFYGTYQATNPDGSMLLTPGGLRQQERAGRDADGQPSGDVLRKVIGDPNPDYTLGFGTDIQFGNFTFNVLFESVQGVDVFDADKRTRQGVGIGEFSEQELRGELPRGWIWSIYPIEEWRISDGSFTKLRELALSYRIDSPFGGSLDNLTIGLAGRNLFSFDNFTSYDPEVNAGGQDNRFRAVNFGTVPIPRTFILTLRTNF